MWWLNIFYGVGWLGYFYLNKQARENNDVNQAVWKQTPLPVIWGELAFGVATWIILGVYINMAIDYDPVTLILFFITQYAYVAIILTQAKDIDDKNPELDLALYTALGLAVAFLLIHLFLGGTYGWMPLIVGFYYCVLRLLCHFFIFHPNRPFGTVC